MDQVFPSQMKLQLSATPILLIRAAALTAGVANHGSFVLVMVAPTIEW